MPVSDPELATRAPENDAAEDQQDSPALSAIAAPTPPPDQPQLCDNCVSDRPTPAGSGAPKGELTTLGGIDVYITKPPSYPSTPARLLLLLTGGTGLKSTNNQLQADLFSAEGNYVVVMPDLFSGDPAPNSKVQEDDPDIQAGSEGGGFIGMFKLKAVETAKSFMIDMWLARHTEDKILPIIHKVLDAAKEEFADAVGNGGGVYAAGYCIGGRYVLLLGQQKEKKGEDVEQGEVKEGPWIKAGAVAHATLVSKQDFVGLKAPVSLVNVENDPMFPDEVRTASEEEMKKGGVEHEVQVYPGVPHGFAVVGQYEDENIKEAQKTAYGQMLKWLQDH
ncbi:Alpha/Beta hydrolase protein [Triangularia verruculosa]|uniref:Alpha/Beta hydrolase protein n=1 Tax=Triangularia verruculosa TaxID=2587418 RepID=A0AAN6X7Y1_9PEZI|nr:Alpha/Beta hydrolase protein [Triangularia verruculosa]